MERSRQRVSPSKTATKITKKNKPKAKPRKLKINKLRDSVWRIVSEYIRLRDSRGNSYLSCFTCDAVVMIGEAHAGHFRHGKNKRTYLMEDNIHGQCPRCNLHLSGNEAIYAVRLIDKIGRENVDRLINLSHEQHMWTRDELENLKEEYTKKLNDLKALNYMQ